MKKGYENQPKNKAQEAASGLGKAYNCKLILTDDDLVALLKELREKIDIINEEFKRCSNLDVTFLSCSGIDKQIWLGPNVQLGIDAVRADVITRNSDPAIEELNIVRRKAQSWDKLQKQIYDMYYDENDQERPDKDGFDLISIGEAAATALGFMQ